MAETSGSPLWWFGPSGGKPLYLLLKHQLLQAEWGNNSHTWGMVTFGEPEAPMPLDFLPGCTKDPFPLRSCHLTTMATKHCADPSSL